MLTIKTTGKMIFLNLAISQNVNDNIMKTLFIQI